MEPASLKSDVVKELHALGEEASVKEAGRKASIWLNQKESEAARAKEKWLGDNKKRPASAPSDEPAPKHHAAALASAPAASAAAGVSVLHLRALQARHLRTAHAKAAARAHIRT